MAIQKGLRACAHFFYNKAKKVHYSSINSEQLVEKAEPNLHLGSLFASADGIILKRELVFSDDSSAVLVTYIGDHVHVGSPHLKLSFPIYDGRKRGTDQKWAFRMTLNRKKKRDYEAMPWSRKSHVILIVDHVFEMAAIFLLL